MKRVEAFRADGIYVLPETVADLPPLAGILTAGAGNPLSHVQLLARNLGIPNVAVDQSLLPELRAGRRQAHRARREPRAAWSRSPRTVRSGTRCSARRQQPTQNVMFEPDLEEARPVGARLRQPRRAAREGLRPHRRAEGGEARRAEVALPRPRGAGRGHSRSGCTARPCSTGPYRNSRQDGVPVDGRELPQARGDARRLARGGGSSPSSCAPRSTRRSSRPIPARSSASSCAPRWRRSSAPNFRGGVFIRSDTNVEDLPGLHRRRPQPDALQRRRLRQHRQGHLRGLGLALHARAPGPGGSRT